MQKTTISICASIVLSFALLATNASAEEISSDPISSEPSSDPIWQTRTGPGVTFGIGFNDCTRDACNYYWDSSFFPSFALNIGFMYRWTPHWLFFAELHNGFIGSDRGIDFDDDWMLLFELTGGAEFHFPVLGWLDPFAGAGIGFAYLGAWADERGTEFYDKLTGFIFQLRLGADFYLFSAAPSFSIAPLFKMGFPVWGNACIDDGDRQDCRSRANFDELQMDARGVNKTLGDAGMQPFTVFFGFVGRYGF